MNKPNPNYVQKRLADALLEKWAPVLDYSSNKVRALEDDHSRLNTAILLENQESWCQNRQGTLLEQNTVGGGVFGTATAAQGGSYTGGNLQGIPATGDANYAQGDARLPKVLIPMIRRTFPELITNEIVGVQPMSGPVGLAFALRYKYSGTNLGAFENDSSSTVGALAGTTAAAAGQELGYGLLETAYTGTSSAHLSGGTDFEITAQDNGIARLLSSFEFSSEIPQVEVSLEKTAVEAGTRRLGAKWSLEIEQDLRNMNGIDIDAELTSAMSYEIQAEIDREMVMRMAQSAINGGNVTVWQAASADARWLGERTRDFYAKVVVEANKVAVRNRRGAANFIIATPKVCAMLEILPEYETMPVNGNVNTGGIGISKVGTVGGRFTVYRDTRTDAQNIGAGVTQRSTPLEYALLGYKGAEYFDTGIVYCPYIPVMIQRAFGPNDFSPRVGLLTRYGIVDNLFGAGLYYSLIVVKGLGDDFVPGATANYL
jgi:hypothetical protein